MLTVADNISQPTVVQKKRDKSGDHRNPNCLVCSHSGLGLHRPSVFISAA